MFLKVAITLFMVMGIANVLLIVCNDDRHVDDGIIQISVNLYTRQGFYCKCNKLDLTWDQQDSAKINIDELTWKILSADASGLFYYDEIKYASVIALITPLDNGGLRINFTTNLCLKHNEVVETLSRLLESHDAHIFRGYPIELR